MLKIFLKCCVTWLKVLSLELWLFLFEDSLTKKPLRVMLVYVRVMFRIIWMDYSVSSHSYLKRWQPYSSERQQLSRSIYHSYPFIHLGKWWLHTWWPAQQCPPVGYHPSHQECGWCQDNAAPQTLDTATGRSSPEIFLHDGPPLVFPEEQINLTWANMLAITMLACWC